MDLVTLKTQDLQTLVQEQLKQYIVRSGLKSGDPLPTEKELAEKFGISRAAVREGLRGMETLGIIGVKPGVGRFIREFNFEAILQNLPYSFQADVKEFREILEVRLCLESWFIAKDIEKFTYDDITELQNILADLEIQVARNSDEKELIDIHTQFHCVLHKKSENALLIDLIKIFATIQRNLTVLHRYKTTDRTQFVLQHKRLLEALEQHDPELAQQRLKEHFAEAKKWVESHSG